MGRIIIDNRSSADDSAAVRLVEQVMLQGRVSNDGKQYCYLTTGTAGGRKVMVSTALNQNSDRFIVIDRPESEF